MVTGRDALFSVPTRRSRRSAGELARPHLADHRHLDLARISHLALDLAGDVARQHHGLVVADPRRLDEDADLATRLHGERLLDAAERVRDSLQVVEPAHVA